MVLFSYRADLGGPEAKSESRTTLPSVSLCLHSEGSQGGRLEVKFAPKTSPVTTTLIVLMPMWFARCWATDIPLRSLFPAQVRGSTITSRLRTASCFPTLFFHRSHSVSERVRSRRDVAVNNESRDSRSVHSALIWFNGGIIVQEQIIANCSDRGKLYLQKATDKCTSKANIPPEGSGKTWLGDLRCTEKSPISSASWNGWEQLWPQAGRWDILSLKHHLVGLGGIIFISSVLSSYLKYVKLRIHINNSNDQSHSKTARQIRCATSRMSSEVSDDRLLCISLGRSLGHWDPARGRSRAHRRDLIC